MTITFLSMYAYPHLYIFNNKHNSITYVRFSVLEESKLIMYKFILMLN